MPLVELSWSDRTVDSCWIWALEEQAGTQRSYDYQLVLRPAGGPYAYDAIRRSPNSPVTGWYNWYVRWRRRRRTVVQQRRDLMWEHRVDLFVAVSLLVVMVVQLVSRQGHQLLWSAASGLGTIACLANVRDTRRRLDVLTGRPAGGRSTFSRPQRRPAEVRII